MIPEGGEQGAIQRALNQPRHSEFQGYMNYMQAEYDRANNNILSVEDRDQVGRDLELTLVDFPEFFVWHKDKVFNLEINSKYFINIYYL